MLLVYNYDKMQEIFNLHEQGKLVFLSISKMDNEDKYLMNYSRIEDYSEEVVAKIEEEMNKLGFLKTRMQVNKVLNDFVKNEKADNLITFNFDYSVLRLLMDPPKPALNYAMATKTTLPDEVDEDLENPFPALKRYIREKACGNLQLPNVFDKPQGTGKNKRQSLLTVSEVIERLEEATK